MGADLFFLTAAVPSRRVVIRPTDLSRHDPDRRRYEPAGRSDRLRSATTLASAGR
jgi:hypothetical protein